MRMVKFIGELHNFREFGYAKYRNRPFDQTIREHRGILKAIKSGSTAEAERAMLHHIRQAVERAKELFLGESSMGNLW
jgi:DNA-binding GntR family transcriptional regulator